MRRERERESRERRRGRAEGRAAGEDRALAAFSSLLVSVLVSPTLAPRGKLLSLLTTTRSDTRPCGYRSALDPARWSGRRRSAKRSSADDESSNTVTAPRSLQGVGRTGGIG